MNKIGDGPRLQPRNTNGDAADGNTGVTTAKVTGTTPASDEMTTPFRQAPPSDLKTTESFETRPVVTDESKSFAASRFKADPRAQHLESKLDGKLESKTSGAGHVHGHDHAHGAHDVHGGEVGELHGASASQVGALPPPRDAKSTFKNVDEARAAITRDFGMTVPANQTWTVEHLSRVHESLSLTGPKEKAALQGVELKRESKPPAGTDTDHEHPVAGAFQPNVATDKGKRKNAPAIVLYDTAFPTTKKPDQDRRATMHIVLHEAGHAVERKGPADILADKNARSDVRNAAVKAEKPTLDANKTANDAFNAALDGKKFPTKELTPLKAFGVASNAANKALESMRTAKTDKALAAAETAYAKAAKERDAALGKMGTGHPVAAEAAELAATQQAFAEKRRDYGAANLPFIAAEAKAKAAYAVLDDPDTAVIESKTKNLQGFEKKIGKENAVSDYGGEASAENFAEAYAMYRRDPQWLKEHNPKAHAFMKASYP